MTFIPTSNLCTLCWQHPCACDTGPTRASDGTAPVTTEPFYNALAMIARGRIDGGRPIGSEDARQIARRTLTDAGKGW